MSSTYVDLVATLVLFFEVSRGYVHGFVRTALDILGGLGSLIIAYLLGPRVAVYLSQNESVSKNVKQLAEAMLPGSFNVPALSPLLGNQGAGALRSSAVTILSSLIFNVMGFVAVLVAVRLVTGLISLGLVRLMDLSSLGFVDKVLGAALGGLRGLFWVIVATCILLLLNRFGMLAIPQAVSESVFFRVCAGAASFLLNILLPAQ